MVRVIVNGVSFYTTKKAIRERRVGSDTNINQAIAALFENMHNAVGIGSRVVTYDHKMQPNSFDIQINL
jgi:hypothetical protein